MTYKWILIAASCSLFAADKLPIGGISHVGFRVADLEKTRAFYAEVMGLEQAFEQKDAQGKINLSVFKINDDQFLEFSPGLADGPDRLSHVAFLSNRLEDLRTIVESLGLKPPELRTGRDRTRNFSIKDPDGLRIEFVHYEPDSLQAQARGKFAGSRRIASHLAQVGFATEDRSRATAFFQGQLGFAGAGGFLGPAGVPGDRIELLPRGAPPSLWFDIPAGRQVGSDVLRDPDDLVIHLKRPSR